MAWLYRTELFLGRLSLGLHWRDRNYERALQLSIPNILTRHQDNPDREQERNTNVTYRASSPLVDSLRIVIFVVNE